MPSSEHSLNGHTGNAQTNPPRRHRSNQRKMSLDVMGESTEFVDFMRTR
jgi:hypothetical protein